MLDSFSVKLIYFFMGTLVGWVVTMGMYQKDLLITNKKIDDIATQIKRIRRPGAWK